MSSQHKKLKLQAITDNLTGLKNRVLLQYSLELAIYHYQRTESPMTIMIINLDGFKCINDFYGHDVLKASGKVISNSLRKSNIAFRIGGKEFLVLLYNADKACGLYVASKLLTEIDVISNQFSQPFTSSMGVASLSDSKLTWQAWLKKCDENLCCAKLNRCSQVLG